MNATLLLRADFHKSARFALGIGVLPESDIGMFG